MIAVADLKSWLGIEVVAYDDILTDLEVRAVALLERETGRYFGAVAETTEYLTGRGTDRLWLQEPPSTDPTTLTERAYVGADETTITAADDDGYVVRKTDMEAWLIRKSGIWTRGFEYEVTYSRGYASGSEPADVQQAVIDIVVRAFKRRGSEGLKSESVGGWSYTLVDDTGAFEISQFTAGVIETWRRPRVA